MGGVGVYGLGDGVTGYFVTGFEGFAVVVFGPRCVELAHGDSATVVDGLDHINTTSVIGLQLCSGRQVHIEIIAGRCITKDRVRVHIVSQLDPSDLWRKAGIALLGRVMTPQQGYCRNGITEL